MPFFRGFILPALALSALTVFSANAGMEKNTVVQPVEPPFDWTGFYIGGNLGGVFSEYEFRGSGGNSEGHLFSDVDIGQQADPIFAGIDRIRFFDRPDNDRPDREQFVSSILGGGQIGYQHQFGHFVVGIEGDFDRTSIRNTEKFRDSVASTVVGPPVGVGSPDGFPGLTLDADTDFTGSREAQTNWLGSARVKFGYATGRLLFYATGGVTFAGVNVWAHDVANTLFTLSENPTQAGTLDRVAAPRIPNQFPGTETFHVVNTSIEKDDDVMFGWTAGAGLEVALNDAVSLALEYRHNDFGDETFSFDHHNNNNGINGPIFSGATNLDFSSDQVTVRMNILLNHLFGGGSYASAAPATNNVAVKSPFGAENAVQVGYTKAKDADKWSAKDKQVAPVVEEFNWTGFYIGANAGGVWNDFDFSDYDAEVNVTPIFEEFVPLGANANVDAPVGDMIPAFFTPFHAPAIDGGSDDSVIGGGQFGYQHQWNHWVFGAEADFSGMSSTKATNYASTSFTFLDKVALVQSNLYSERKATVDWNASARLKIGYARGPVMLYITGGPAWANVRTWATDLVVSDFFIPFVNKGDGLNFRGRATNNTNDEDLVFGYTLGGGAEWAFSKIASLAMEYRHNGFDSADAHYDPHHMPIFADGYHVDLDSDQVTVRVNLLLGNMGPGH